MIEVPEIRRPRPPPHFDAGALRHILEGPVSAISVQRIAERMSAIEATDFLRRVGMKLLLSGDPLSRRLPHTRHVDVLTRVVVEVAPTAAHARAYFFHVSSLRRIREGAVSVVAVELAAAEIIRYKQVRVAARTRLSPRAAKL